MSALCTRCLSFTRPYLTNASACGNMLLEFLVNIVLGLVTLAIICGIPYLLAVAVAWFLQWEAGWEGSIWINAFYLIIALLWIVVGFMLLIGLFILLTACFHYCTAERQRWIDTERLIERDQHDVAVENST